MTFNFILKKKYVSDTYFKIVIKYDRDRERERKRETDRQTDKTDRQTDRQTARQTYRQTYRQTDRGTGRETDRVNFEMFINLNHKISCKKIQKFFKESLITV